MLCSALMRVMWCSGHSVLCGVVRYRVECVVVRYSVVCGVVCSSICCGVVRFSVGCGGVRYRVGCGKRKKEKRKNVYSNKKYLILQCLHT